MSRLFIVDGIISLPIALAGYLFIPDVPETTRAFYLSIDDRAFANKRMQLEGRKPRAPYTKAKLLKILRSWHIYALTALYVFFNNGAAGAAPVFAQFLKDSKHPKYTIAQINDYPTTTYAVQIITTLLYAWTSDSILNGDRLPPIVFGGVFSPANSFTQGIGQRLITTASSSIYFAIYLLQSGIFQRAGDGPATF